MVDQHTCAVDVGDLGFLDHCPAVGAEVQAHVPGVVHLAAAQGGRRGSGDLDPAAGELAPFDRRSAVGDHDGRLPVAAFDDQPAQFAPRSAHRQRGAERADDPHRPEALFRDQGDLAFQDDTLRIDTRLDRDHRAGLGLAHSRDDGPVRAPAARRHP